MTFTSVQETESATATMETANAASESGKFLYYNDAIKVDYALFDHTNAGTTYFSTRLTGGNTNAVYGLTKTLSVMPGDVINTEVYAKYLDTESGNRTPDLNTFIAAINGPTPPAAYVDGLSPGSIGGGTYPITGINHSSESGTAPKAYLNYMVFNRDFVLLTSGFRRISTAAKESGSDVAHEKLAFDGVDQIKISEPGYVYIYLSNENPTTVEVYFDDFKVEHIKSAVVQTEDYYPFGLGYNSYLRQDYLLNHWKFQGQDHIDDLALNWDSFRWRNHQPEIGRFFSIDPLSTKYYYNSPYAFSENKVVAHRELEGLESFPSNCEGCSTGERKEYYKQQTKAHMEAFWRAIPGAVQGTAEKMASMSDANDIIVIVTTITRGENAVNIDDSKATTTDKVFAGVGIVLPVVSGSAAKKIATEVGGALFEGIMKKVGNISTHLTDNDVAGAIKDIMGKPIIINGKQYDHLDEVTSALRGLGNQIEKLNKLISSGDLSKESIKEAERIRSSLQNEKDKIQNILNKAKNEAKDQ